MGPGYGEGGGDSNEEEGEEAARGEAVAAVAHLLIVADTGRHLVLGLALGLVLVLPGLVPGTGLVLGNATAVGVLLLWKQKEDNVNTELC